MKNKLRAAILLTSISLIAMHIINRILSFFTNKKDTKTLGNSNYFEWRFGKIHYSKQGKGKPVLLVHDLFVGSSSYEWEKIVGSLAKTNTVYTLDLLGCGHSEKPAITFTNYMYVELLNDFISEHIKEKVSIIATGTSCSLALMSCHMNENLYDKVMIVNPEQLYLSKQIPSQLTKGAKLILDAPIVGTFIYNAIFTKSHIEKILHNNFYSNGYLVSNKTISSYYHSAHIGDGNGKYLYSSQVGKYLNANVENAIASTNLSIYLILGTNIPGKSELIHSYVQLNASIEVVEVNNSKQLPQLENPAEFVENVTLFLS